MEAPGDARGVDLSRRIGSAACRSALCASAYARSALAIRPEIADARGARWHAGPFGPVPFRTGPVRHIRVRRLHGLVRRNSDGLSIALK